MLVAWAAAFALAPVGAATTPTAEPAGVRYFSVLNQRNPILTARYWNPILRWVSERSGVPLRLRMGKTAPETTAMTVRGEASFAYTNHLFTPERSRLGWRVIARAAGAGIAGEIVTPAASAIYSLADLDGKEIVFPSPEAFVGYWVPMDALQRAGVKVNPSFGGNQEGAMTQLKVGRVVAAAVNGRVMEDFARREGFAYRTIWRSETFLDLAVMVHPTLPAAEAAAVRDALLAMSSDPAGRAVLAEAAALVQQQGSLGFVAADDRDYENYRRFYRETVLTGTAP